MGFNKKFLPELEVLLEEYERLGHDKFRSVYFKYDAFIGLDGEKKEFLDQVMIENKPYKEYKTWYKRIWESIVNIF